MNSFDINLLLLYLHNIEVFDIVVCELKKKILI